MNKVEQTLIELYPNYTIQPPINLDFHRAGWELHPLPSDYLIIPPGFHDDTPTQEVRNWARVIRDDGDLRLSICTFPKVVDTFSGQEVINPGDFATEVFLPESERFTKCSIRKLVEMGPNGENFNKAVNQLMDDAAELRTAKRRLEALLEIDTDKLRISQSVNCTFEADFVELYRSKLQATPEQKISLSGEGHLRIAKEMAVYAIQHEQGYGIDDADLQLILEEYAPYGKTAICIPGSGVSSYGNFIMDEAHGIVELLEAEGRQSTGGEGHAET